MREDRLRQQSRFLGRIPRSAPDLHHHKTRRYRELSPHKRNELYKNREPKYQSSVSIVDTSIGLQPVEVMAELMHGIAHSGRPFAVSDDNSSSIEFP